MACLCSKLFKEMQEYFFAMVDYTETREILNDSLLFTNKSVSSERIWSHC